jgi:hypothetical protein
MVDLDRFGRALGIEVIRPARHWPIEEIINRFDVATDDREELLRLFRADGPFPFAKQLESVPA